MVACFGRTFVLDGDETVTEAQFDWLLYLLTAADIAWIYWLFRD